MPANKTEPMNKKSGKGAEYNSIAFD